MRPLIFVLMDAPASRLGLNLTDKAVLQSLVGHLNQKRNGSEVWPSNARIAELTGGHPETVVKAKLRLHEKGLIKIRRDSGKSDMCTINEELIRQLSDPLENPGGSEAAAEQDPPVNAGGYPPVNTGGTPPEIPPRTAKEQPKGNYQPDLYPLGCSANLKVGDGDHQRKLAVHGIVARTAQQLRADRQEQPTEKKQPDDSDSWPVGALAVRERPG